MKIALGQMYVRAAHCEENFDRVKKIVETAKNNNSDIVVLPELCISGRFVGDKLNDIDFGNYIHSYSEKIRELSDGITIVFGNIFYDFDNTFCKNNKINRYNTIFVAKDQKWVKNSSKVMDGMYIKHTSVNEHISDDGRYYTSGVEVSENNYNDKTSLLSTFNVDINGIDKKFAVLHLDDVMNSSIMKHYMDKDIDAIFCVASKNWINQEHHSLKDCLDLYYETYKDRLPIIYYVNAVGMQNTGKNMVVMDGGSFVYKNGKITSRLNDAFEEEVFYHENNMDQISKPCENKLLEALTYTIKEVDKQMFNSSLKWIIGLSGGIDSSINAALLVKAIGNKRIVGYNMASAYNSLTTKNNARILAEGLGIEIREGSIELLNEASLKTMEMYNYTDTYGSLVYENIQARIRGHLLSTFASIEGGVIINNANKIEVALGYCTLYGDAIGALAPIGDLTKVECFEVARGLNTYFGKEVISSTLIPEVEGDNIKWDMPPSAELKDAQFDPMKWFYHDEIIKMLMEDSSSTIEMFMQSFLDDSIYETSMGKWIRYYHLEKGTNFMNDLEWLFRTMSNATFKRIQMPPIALISNGAFGSDYRESQLGFIQTTRYKELKNQILMK